MVGENMFGLKKQARVGENMAGLEREHGWVREKRVGLKRTRLGLKEKGRFG